MVINKHTLFFYNQTQFEHFNVLNGYSCESYVHAYLLWSLLLLLKHVEICETCRISETFLITLVILTNASG